MAPLLWPRLWIPFSGVRGGRKAWRRYSLSGVGPDGPGCALIGCWSCPRGISVWVSLDATIGWDFMYPGDFLRSSGFLGNIREVGDAPAPSQHLPAAELVAAARRGLVDAIRSGNETDATVPVRQFWDGNTSFTPHHLGRCYPHGHPELTDKAGTISCQVDTLQRLAIQLVRSSERPSHAAADPGEAARDQPGRR